MNLISCASARRILPALAFVFASACAGGVESISAQAQEKKFDTPAFKDFEAHYTSSFSKSGAFMLQMRNVEGGKKIHMMDVIPGADSVIVAFRQIDAETHFIEFGAGPFFAWGQEYIVRQMGEGGYDWVRTPIGGGDPVRITGEIEAGGFVVDTFSPTLASLMPKDVGENFQLPVSQPLKSGDISTVMSDFEVVARETMSLPSGVSCECWVIEQQSSGMTNRLWVAREAPFLFRWHRDIGGQREFVSEVLSYRVLEK